MPWKSPKGELLYRIGDVIISTNAQNPSTFFGGTWQLLCPGRTLVCVDTSDIDFNAVKKTGGEKKHVLTVAEMPSHTHIQNAHTHGGSSGNAGNHSHSATTGSAGAHVHGIKGYDKKGASGTATYRVGAGGDSTGTGICVSAGAHTHGVSIVSSGAHTHVISINSTNAINQNMGGSLAHNNLQPFMAVYMWVRIA